MLAGVLQRDDPAALAQPLDVYARAVAAYPALRVAVGSVLSGNLETWCRAAIGQAASHTNLDLLLGTTTAAGALNRALTVVDVDPAALPAAVNLFPVGRRGTRILSPIGMRTAPVGCDDLASTFLVVRSCAGLDLMSYPTTTDRDGGSK